MNRDQLKGAIGLYLSQNLGTSSLQSMQVAEGVLWIIENAESPTPQTQALIDANQQITTLKQELAAAKPANPTPVPPASGGGA